MSLGEWARSHFDAGVKVERERCALLVEAAEPYTLTEVLAERIRKPGLPTFPEGYIPGRVEA